MYPVFVPRADNDGMSIAGIRMLPLAVPRATYTGCRTLVRQVPQA